MDLMEQFVKITIVNVLWLLCSLPVVTAGAATKAMYASLYRIRQRQQGVVKSFFAAFRKQFWVTTGLWMLILLVAAGLTADFLILSNMEFAGQIAAYGLLAFFALLLLIFDGMLFPMLSQFPCSWKEGIKNAFLLGLAHLPRMIPVTILNLAPLLMLVFASDVFLYMGGLWLICGFALLAYGNIKLLEPVFAPYRSAEEPDGSKE